MSIPHQDPGPDVRPDQTARAPYNFVPLPENDAIVTLGYEQLPDHNVYAARRHTGWFDVTLTTRSPLYIRGMLISAEFQNDNAQPPRALDGRPVKDRSGKRVPYTHLPKNKAAFFHKRRQEIPVLPGSSLRGMLRVMVEIAGYGKFDRVTEKRLFYRNLNDNDYRNRVTNVLPRLDGGFQRHEPFDEVQTRGDGFESKIEAGFFRRNADGTAHIEVCDLARLDDPAIHALYGTDLLYEGRNGPSVGGGDANATPRWRIEVNGKPQHLQHGKIWVRADDQAYNYLFPAQQKKDRQGNQLFKNGKPDYRHRDQYLRFRQAFAPQFERPAEADINVNVRQGTLVLTGPMQHKHLAFVFLPTLAATSETISLPDDSTDPNERLLERFHDEDQRTPWQENAFPVDRPVPNSRREAGYLRDGDPVFFLREEGQLVFFGRALMFRLPYKNRPINLVPAALQNGRALDYADALFGYVRDHKTEPTARAGDKRRAYSGRIAVTEGKMVSAPDNDPWLVPGALTPRLLASPKPTAYQHYLTQRLSAYRDSRTLFHYDSGVGETTLRGHKLYWPQRLPQNGNWTRHISADGNVPDSSTQHTRMRPVKPGVIFAFRVYFENLDAKELGALCWALQPASRPVGTYWHKLGMGKPFGMGSAELEATLHLTGRPDRYTNLLDGDSWNAGKAEESATLDWATAVQAFEEDVLAQIGAGNGTALADQRRIEALLKMMHSAGVSIQEAQTMSLDRDGANPVFKSRPVLPGPLASRFR